MLMPPPPDSILPLISSKWRATDNGGESEWIAPRSVTAEQIAVAQKFAKDVLIARPAAPLQLLKDRLSSLLAHYFSNATGDKLNAMVASDWIHALELFPLKAVTSAAQEWVSNKPEKPKLSDFKDLCITFYGRKDWNYFERAIIIGRMLPSSAPATTSNAKPKEDTWQKPDAAAKERVAVTMHNGGFHNGKYDPNCPKCRESAP